MSQKFKIGDNWIIRIQQLQIVERLHKIMSHLFKLTCFKIRSHLFKLTCSWNKVYIEETARNFATKCNEHLKTTGKSLTEVVQHLKKKTPTTRSIRTILNSLVSVASLKSGKSWKVYTFRNTTTKINCWMITKVAWKSFYLTYQLLRL